eukprot:scaffold27210_cov32-Prasinocladus_malaysianus.AAC.1
MSRVHGWRADLYYTRPSGFMVMAEVSTSTHTSVIHPVVQATLGRQNHQAWAKQAPCHVCILQATAVPFGASLVMCSLKCWILMSRVNTNHVIPFII